MTLSPPQLSVMISLADGDKTMARIAEEWPTHGVRSLAGALSSLERRGWIGDVALIDRHLLHGLTERGKEAMAE